jgi:hypothetical protein
MLETKESPAQQAPGAERDWNSNQFQYTATLACTRAKSLIVNLALTGELSYAMAGRLIRWGGLTHV